LYVIRSASAAPSVLIACIGFIDCELRYVAVAILCLTYFTNSCCRAGMMVNHVDISPKSDIVSPILCIRRQTAPVAYLGFSTRRGRKMQ